jgi:hypothetical protein
MQMPLFVRHVPSPRWRVRLQLPAMVRTFTAAVLLFALLATAAPRRPPPGIFRRLHGAH